VAQTPVEQIAGFHAERYVPANVVIAAAGSLDHDRLVELATERVPGANAYGPLPITPAPHSLTPQRRFERKDTEQYHVCLGGPGLSRHDERRFAWRVLDTIFGGTSSSRLFQEIRERRGLAYSVYSFTSAYQDAGQSGLYVGTRADNVVQALEVIGGELERIRAEPALAEELTRAKENLKGRVVLALESTGARMSRLGSEVLAGAPLLRIDEVVRRIDAVSMDDLAELAHELWAPEQLSAAGIGPDEARFEEGLAAIGPLAEAAPAGTRA
jgi:predicted Zn-dependent peptidase